MRFTKMQGAGNDYVYINGFDQSLPEDLAGLARRISDRHFGVGGDGLILIRPSQVADARMQMFNADGSESEMCGNGISVRGQVRPRAWDLPQPAAPHRDRPRRAPLGPGSGRGPGAPGPR